MNPQDRERIDRLCAAFEIDLDSAIRIAADEWMSANQVRISVLANHLAALGSEAEYELGDHEDGDQLVADLAALRIAGVLP